VKRHARSGALDAERPGSEQASEKEIARIDELAALKKNGAAPGARGDGG
jgi:hypothetical protein